MSWRESIALPPAFLSGGGCMAGDDVTEVKTRLDITEVIGDYVALRKKGQTYWGSCPFHKEKTPSFSVSSERQTFHCFGCGKGGDVFTFIMEIESLDFKEALERLADRAGVKLRTRSGKSRDGALSGKDILKNALGFFIDTLCGNSGEAARAYLSRRSLSVSDIKRFEIGWAPPSWDALSRHLSGLGYSDEQMMEYGLVSMGARGPYDRFRGRIMFPIYSTAGRIVGFGGRILDGDGAKYLNSPESSVFVKRSNLYLMDKAKGSIREMGKAILVEGYMDAIRCHLSGYTNTVASLGTSLAEAQAALIKRMTGLCYICYDSDSAGQEAALRGMYVLQRQGVAVRVIRLPDAKDPDELLLREDGKEVFESALSAAIPLPVYHAVLRKTDIEAPESSAAARNDLLDGLASLSPFDISGHVETIAQQMGVFPHELIKEIDERRRKPRIAEQPDGAEDGFWETGHDEDVEERSQDGHDDLECVLCGLLWGSEALRSEFPPEQIVPFIKDERLQNLASALLSGEQPAELEERWRQLGDRESFKLIARSNGIIAKESIDAEKAESIAETLRRRCIAERAASLGLRLKKGIATEADMEEHLRLTRILKGGNFGS